MTTFGNLRDRSFRLIGNNTGEGIESGLIVDAIGAALDAILPWFPKIKQTTLTGDGTVKAFSLPTDFYAVEAVVVYLTGEILGQAVFSPAAYFGEYIEGTNSWKLLPSGQLSFAKTPESGQVFDLYYCAAWPKPTENTQDTDALEPPSHLDTALAYYTAAGLLMPDAIGVAGISSYKTRVDSGNPEHNPVEKAISFLLNLFNQEMSRHPRHQRAQV